MNPQDPLAALAPLREPAAVGWWPPAPGWWMLAIALLAALGTLAWYLWRRHRANAYRRRAALQLQTLEAQYAADGDAVRFLTGANALLKSVALCAYPRRDVASIHGEAWVNFLRESVRGDSGFDTDFGDALYRPATDAVNCERIARAARNWIERHEVAA